MKVAIIGGGAAGLCCAYWLSQLHDITLFEAESRLGGHANTVDVEVAGERLAVDTGFIVYNERNYPRFTKLLEEVGVETQPSEMSFSVSSGCSDFEYRGNGLGLWAQPTNLLDRSYQRLLLDILRFNRDARRLLRSRNDGVRGTLEDFLADGNYGTRLAEQYLVPLGAAIWSADPHTFAAIPALTFARFMDNHGMLDLKGRPQWRTVRGGAAIYVGAMERRIIGNVERCRPVEKLVRGAEGVTVLSEYGPEPFDAAVLAVHSDQALALLGDPSPEEQDILAAIRYRPNIATLHTDRSMLPRRRRAWAAWNSYLPPASTSAPTVTYWMNCLQRLDTTVPLCVTLNRSDEIDAATVLGQWTYHHPVYDLVAVDAQTRRHEIQGRNNTWYCGAYWGYGFHEDAVESAAVVCRGLGAVIR